MTADRTMGDVCGALDLDLVATANRVVEHLRQDAPSSPLSLEVQSRLLSALESTTTSIEGPTKALLLDALSDALLIPQSTCDVALLVRPVLVDLTARWVSDLSQPEAARSQLSWSQERTQAIFHAFARLLYPFEEVYDSLYLFLCEPGLEGQHMLDYVKDTASVQALLLSAWRLLFASPTLTYYTKFPLQAARLLSLWDHTQEYTSSSASVELSPTTRLLAIKVYAQLVGLPPATRIEYEIRRVGEASFSDQMALELASSQRAPSAQDSSMAVDFEVDNIQHTGVQAWAFIESEGLPVEQVDIWILPYLELQRAQRLWLRRASESVALHSEQHTQQRQWRLVEADLHPQVTQSAGVLLMRQGSVDNARSAGPSTHQNSRFVETASARSTLRQMATLASRRRPVLLTGAPACGKTSLIHHLCDQVARSGADRTILTLQLGDQSGVDSKQLLGSFVSSPTDPGTFEWRDGALTHAVRSGMWVVLEDIDRASTDVLQVVGQLVEDLTATRDIGRRPMLDLGTRGTVRAGQGFQLFATRSVAPAIDSGPKHRQNRYPTASFLGANHWAEVAMSAPDDEDVSEIVHSKFSAVMDDDLFSRMITAWKRVQAYGGQDDGAASGNAVPTAGSKRTITIRDLLKWCDRMEAASNEAAATGQGAFTLTSSRERLFLEGCDVFLSSIPAPAVKSSKKGKAVDRHSALVHILADALELPDERAYSALQSRIPECSVQRSGLDVAKTVCLGRARLRRAEESLADESMLVLLGGATVPTSANFALTKTSLIMLERIAMAASLAEPVLLVGETGTGKTTLVQHLASLLRKPLVALNLSQQTESGDLLGGFKPLDPKLPASEVHNTWTSLFQRTFSAKRNVTYIEAERKAFKSGKWKRLIGLWRESARMAAGRRRRSQNQSLLSADDEATASRKRRKTEAGPSRGDDPAGRDIVEDAELDAEWSQFEADVDAFEARHASMRNKFVFSFVEGPLVHALRNGHWILLDEINLAASEVLQCLSGLLQSRTSSVTLTDRGDTVPVVRHPDFRLFACMNPATDVGKKDLAMSLRQRFTELYIPSPDTDIDALTSIVDKYIGQLAVGDRGAILDAAEAYAQIQALSRAHELADGANQRPHYSVRTLSRALRFAADTAKVFGLRRALYEGFLMAFSMSLESSSLAKLVEVLQRNIIAKSKNPRQVASLVPAMPSGEGKSYVQVGAFWLETGALEPETVEDYVLTPSVQDKLIGLARAVMTRKYPVLIQGPTSAGKTSAIEYLAKRTGHAFVRINNHEHTDVQEYLGTYANDPSTGQLKFREGLLVNALRHGHWIVLDELNLAPTDVLEALNRLLDDNRELIIPETGEVVRPHPRFMLFATQNPPGLYAGRKVLSRAFRNRFLEIHFDDVPQAELEVILADRCKIAPSYAAKMVAVFIELQRRRQTSRVFETKQAFVTLRDLFRWGQREAVGYQALAENGYMLIAERARRQDDKQVVKEVLEEMMNVTIPTPSMLYDIGSRSAHGRLGKEFAQQLSASRASSSVVWTGAMTRLLYLISAAFRHNEPVLLVGETGTGKTSVCEAISSALGKQLHAVNCHQNTDTADLLGGQRPLRNRAARRAAGEVQARAALSQLLDEVDAAALPQATAEVLLSAINAQLATWTPEKEARLPKDALEEARKSITDAMALFEWNDGPLVQAMRAGDHVLLDEISLADDSILERLNSVLESGRSLVLTDGFVTERKDKNDTIGSALLVASEGFQFAATMNPGGDYGKKELSPALRNRFTEIWVPHVDEREDLLKIIDSRWTSEDLRGWSEPILNFAADINAELGGHPTMGIRDMIAWVVFMNNIVRSADGGVLTPEEAFIHGALLTVIDGLGTLPATAHMPQSRIDALRQRCLDRLGQVVSPAVVATCSQLQVVVTEDDEAIRLGSFPLYKRPGVYDVTSAPFSLKASSPALNALRVVRALSVSQKAILLEGSPGAGKTSLITALAKASRTPLTRINLSDQTELVDLFGSDLPVEGGGPGEFAWRDAAFLRAMVRGEWVLLDEMNLASQSVLEGLNSCLDHRGTVYVPELARSFSKHPDFRIFAAQNPIGQGGGRKGLPQSFLNRFTKVYVNELTESDMLGICEEIFDQVDTVLMRDMIKFNKELQEATMVHHFFGRNGTPWEFNLRDVLRWMLLITASDPDEQRDVAIDRVRSMYLDRFRTAADRQAAWTLFKRTFGPQDANPQNPELHFQVGQFEIGNTALPSMRTLLQEGDRCAPAILQSHLAAMDTLAESVKYNRLSIVLGPSGSGKTSCVKALARAAGVSLEIIRMSPGMDTTDLLGSFEQEDPWADLRRWAQIHVSRLSSKIANPDTPLQQLATLLKLRTALIDLTPSPDGLEDLLSIIGTQLSTSNIGSEESREFLAFVEVARRVKEGASQGPKHFRWTDGPLLRALKDGRWLLLDGANLCSASVLDRFNSLFEDRGTLVLSERGMVDGEVPVIRPHPKFRAFMTIDPKHGELSRAMRNRGIEIYLDGAHGHPSTDADKGRLDFLRRDIDAISKSASGACLANARVYATHPELFQATISTTPLLKAGADDHDTDATDARAVQVMVKLGEQAHLAGHMIITDVSSSSAAAKLVKAAMDSSLLKSLSSWQSMKSSDFMHALELVAAAAIFSARLRNVKALSASKDIASLSVLERSAIADEGGLDGEHSAEDIVYPLLVALAAIAQGLATRHNSSAHQFSALRDIHDISAFVAQSCLGAHVDYSVLQMAQERLQDRLAVLQQDTTVVGSSDANYAVTIVERLASKVTLQRGLAMHPIWQLFVAGGLPEEARRLRDQLASELREDHSAGSEQIIRSALDVAATLSSAISTDIPAQTHELISLASRTLQALQGRRTETAGAESTPISKFARHTETLKFVLCSLLWQGSLSPFQPTRGEASTQTPNKLVDTYLESAARLPETAIRVRSAAWTNTHADSAMSMSVLQSLDFVSDLERLDAAHGVGLIFRPVFLQSAVASGQISMVSLRDLNTLKNMKRRSAKMLSLALSSHAQTVKERLCFVLADFVALLTQVLCPTITAECESLAIKRLASDLGSNVFDVKTLQQELDNIDGHELGSARGSRTTEQWLVCLRQVSLVLKNPRRSKLSVIGAALVKVAQASFQLYWPNVPVDPLAPSRVEREFLQARSKRLSARLQVLAEYENETTGNLDNELQRYLRTMLADIAAQQDAIAAPQLDRRSDLAELAQLHQDVLSFLCQVLDERQVNSMVADLLDRPTSTAEARAATVRASISNFRDRMPRISPNLQDVWTPLLSMLDMMSLGLAALVEGGHQEGAGKSTALATGVITAATAHPSPRSSEQLHAILSHKSVVLKQEPSLCLLGLHTVQDLPTQIQRRPEQLTLVDALYSRIYGVWAGERAERQREAADAASIYKSRKDDVVVPSEEELDERDFQSLFPDYGDGLTDSTAPAMDEVVQETSALSSEDKLELLRLHFALAGHDQVTSTARKEAVVKAFVDRYLPTLPQDIDNSSSLFQTSMHARWMDTVEAIGPKEFYRESNPAEVQKAVAIVQALRDTLERLLHDWPDQLVLQHIQDRCDAILDLRADLPVARILSAMELLLAHTDDWESYASSKTSLGLHREQITALIISWRRLELSSWSTLLDYAAAQQLHQVSDWWFHFFETTVLGALDAAAKGSDALESHLGAVVKLVDDFMRTSTTGQYQHRLQLLSSFATYFEMRTDQDPTGPVASRMSRILGNLHSFFQQAASTVASSLEQQRKVLEKDIATFAKLASWKDVNVHALKQSAQKSHRRLHKTIRKYRDILRQPVDPILAQTATPRVDSKAEHGAAHDQPFATSGTLGCTLPTGPAADWAQGKAHLLNLERTLTVFESLSRGKLSTFLGQSVATALQNLGVEVIQRTQQLSKATPAHLTEDNSKLVKQLAVRKQRAWTDLLQEQRRIGLSSYQNPQKMAPLKEPLLLFSIERFKFDHLPQHTQALLHRAEGYHWRLLTSLPRSHDALQRRCEDVSVSELLKGVHYVEHGALLAIQERSRLANSIQQLKRIEIIVSALRRLDDGPDGQAHLLSAAETLCFTNLSTFNSQAIRVLQDAEMEAPHHEAASIFPPTGVDSFKTSLAAHASQLLNLRDEYEEIVRHIAKGMPSILRKSDEGIVGRVQATVDAICLSLDDVAARSPAISSLCRSTSTWFREALAKSLAALDAPTTNSFHSEVDTLPESSNRVIDSILVISQDVQALQAAQSETDGTEELPSGGVTAQCQLFMSISKRLRLDEVGDQLMTLIQAAARRPSPSEETTYALRRLGPFLAIYNQLAQQHLHTSSQWYATLLKYLYIVNQTVQSMIEKGFCKPKDDAEQSDSKQGADDAEAGTGLADGSGAQDITDQLEDDEEIEEMQRDEKDQDDGPGVTEKQKGAKESGLDLDGAAEEKEADEDAQEDDKTEGEEENEPDEEIDNVDPLDPNAVDEKMWDGSHDQEKDDGGEVRDDKDAGDQDDLNAPKQDSDPQTRHDADKPNKDDDEEQSDPGDGQDPHPDTPDNVEERSDEGNEEEDGSAMPQQAPAMEDIQDGEVLDDIADLPDDGDVDNNEDMDDADELESLADLQPEAPEPEADDMSFDEQDADADVPVPPDGADGQEEGEESEAVDNKDPETQGLDDTEVDDDELKSEVDGETEQQPPSDQRAPEQHIDMAADAEHEAAENLHPQVLDSAADTDQSTQMDKSSAAAVGKQTMGATGEQSSGLQVDSADDAPKPHTIPEQERQERGQGNETGAPAPNQSDTMAAERDGVNEEDRVNPIRSLGDALQEFRRRLDEIQRASEDQPSTSEPKQDGEEDFPELGEVEHVAHDQEADAQALGAANDDEVRKLDSSALHDETRQDNKTSFDPSVEDVQMEEPPLQDLAADQQRTSAQRHKGALLPSEVQPNRCDMESDDDDVLIAEPDDSDTPATPQQPDPEERADGPTTEPERHDADVALQSELALLQAAGEETRVQKAAELWTSYSSLTADLSLALCEQLRLILAPTLASRLSGDYRTGKRLNMRKIIPFIASDFAKDKIWLRRTKPSAREYQVLLAIDDSRSMSETRSAHLAYQTLALVTGALARLEVGDVSVCRFGAEVEMLHDFGKGAIGQQDGAKIIERLSFQQRSTNVLRLVSDSLRILADARDKSASTSSTAAELWQLQIIVSDGVCQDHAKLRAMLRRAAEQRVMLVFVVVDALAQTNTSTSTSRTQDAAPNGSRLAGTDQPRNSILTMQQVSYQLGPDGKLDMRLERYLDTFPFEYYVVVRDVEALPDVLAETLRQWAEKIREGN